MANAFSGYVYCLPTSHLCNITKFHHSPSVVEWTPINDHQPISETLITSALIGLKTFGSVYIENPCFVFLLIYSLSILCMYILRSHTPFSLLLSSLIYPPMPSSSTKLALHLQVFLFYFCFCFVSR